MKTMQLFPTYKCVILNRDQSLACELSAYLKELPHMEVVGIYSNPQHAVSVICREDQIDFLFLEIGIGNLSGFEMAIKFRSLVKFIVFISSQSEYALDAFQAGGDQYLLRPLLLSKFASVIGSLLSKDKALGSLSITPIHDGEWLRIPKLK
jgi:DNA-binding LytR/AlgR family response regulator